MGIAVSPAGQVATASFDNSVGLWTGRAPQWLEGHDAAVTSISFPEEDTILTGSDDFSVRLWEDAKMRILGSHQGKVTDVVLSPDGQIVFSASWDGKIGLWDRNGAGHRLLRGQGGVNDIAFSADGEEVFAATMTGRITAYRVDGERDDFRPVINHGFGINRLISDDGWLAYGAVDGVTRIVDPESGQSIADFSLDRRPILALAYHAPSGQLAVGDGHGYIMIIDTESWQIARDFRAMRNGPVWALGFSSDGTMIFAGGIEDVVYGWPIALLNEFEPAGEDTRSFLQSEEAMPNGERQFMRKCSICHALTNEPSRKAGPTLYGVFGRRAGALPDYLYSQTLDDSAIIWAEDTIDALFDLGPDQYIPGSKMPMQRITKSTDRQDLIDFLKSATKTRK